LTAKILDATTQVKIEEEKAENSSTQEDMSEDRKLSEELEQKLDINNKDRPILVNLILISLVFS
jgi:hypothetical protein